MCRSSTPQTQGEQQGDHTTESATMAGMHNNLIDRLQGNAHVHTRLQPGRSGRVLQRSKPPACVTKTAHSPPNG
jgi:hypothetical protein